MNTSTLVKKLWNYWNVLRDDGDSPKLRRDCGTRYSIFDPVRAAREAAGAAGVVFEWPGRRLSIGRA